MLKDIILAFIPLFVAVDAIGILPVYVSLTNGLKKEDKRKVIIESMVTAICLAIGFLFLGRAIFKFLNITIGDFMVAGGLLLFIIAIRDIVSTSIKRKISIDELGTVPLGTPLIVGPAVLTTTLLMMDQHGLMPTLIAVFLNVIIAGVVFFFSRFLIKIIGESGARALSKVTSLLLAAIAVMMVRKGVIVILGMV